MTIADILDQTLVDIGVPKDKIEKARREALSMLATSDMKERLNRELADDEIERYKGIAMLYWATIITSPEFRQAITDEINKIRERN